MFLRTKQQCVSIAVSKTMTMKKSSTFHLCMKGIKTTLLVILLGYNMPAIAQLIVNAGQDQTICFGSVITLGGFPTAQGGAAPFSYNWSPAAGLSSSSVSNPLANPGTSTTYSVTVTDNTSATASASVTINVAPALSASLLSNNDGVLPDTLNINVFGGCPPYIYTWNNGSNVQQLTATTNGPYTVTVTDNCGCTGTATTTINSGFLTITYPNGGEVFNAGQNVAVTWTSQNTSGFVKIEAYSSIAFNWITLAASITDNGLFNFTVPNVPGSQGIIRISDVANAAIADESDGLFNIVAGSLQIDSVNTVEVSCFGLSNGSITVHASGGASPLQYSIDGGVTFQSSNIFSNVSAGTYAIEVKDANNVLVSGNASITQNPLLLIDSIVVADVSCLLGQNGSACVYVSGGTGNYNYVWNPVTIGGSCSITLQAGNYDFTVSDDAGCIASGSVTINEPSTAVTLNVISETMDGAPDTLSVSPTGGQEPYIVYWQNATNQFVGEGDTVTNVFYSNGIYNILCYDSLGCMANYVYNNTNLPSDCNIDTLFANVLDTLCFPAGIIDSISILTPPQHGQISFFGSTCASYASVSGYTGDDFFELRIYTLGGVVLDTQAYCYFIKPNCTDLCVWPGDANYDGITDNNDLLPVGLAYAANGSPRAQQDIDWYAHTATDWADTLSDGTNYKHIDANGNGIINEDDTLAILTNFGLSHPRSGMPEPRGNVPVLQIQMVPDTLVDGATVVANLLLGDANFSATNVYGLAFTFNFDPAVVDSTEYGIAFAHNSWLCSSSADHIDIDKKLFSAGQIKAAITRIDHTSRSGAGEIGTVSMKITTGNINGKNLSYYTMHTYISDLVMIDQNGNQLLVDAGNDSANIEFEPTGINDLNGSAPQFLLVPNPAVDALNIIGSETALESVMVINGLCEIIEVPVIRQSNSGLLLDISALSAGLYFIQVHSTNGVSVQRFVKLK